MQTAQSRRTYDHQIRQAILESRDRDLFPNLDIPRSTVRSWIHRGMPDIVANGRVTCERAALLAEVHALRMRTAIFAAVVGLLVTMLRVSKIRPGYERYADGKAKAVPLRAIERSTKVLPLHSLRHSGPYR